MVLHNLRVAFLCIMSLFLKRVFFFSTIIYVQVLYNLRARLVSLFMAGCIFAGIFPLLVHFLKKTKCPHIVIVDILGQ